MSQTHSKQRRHVQRCLDSMPPREWRQIKYFIRILILTEFDFVLMDLRQLIHSSMSFRLSAQTFSVRKGVIIWNKENLLKEFFYYH